MELDDAGLFVIEPDGDVLAHDRTLRRAPGHCYRSRGGRSG
jgi:hypothetical protein